MQSNLGGADTLLSFRDNLIAKILTDREILSYFMKGQRKLSVIHARICNNCSDLKCDLFIFQMILDAVVAALKKMRFISFSNVKIMLTDVQSCFVKH